LTVNTAVLQMITVTPGNPSIPNGVTQQFMATGVYSDGSQRAVTGLVAWSSDSPLNATMNSSGLATATAVSSSVITATLGAVSGSATLTVTGAELQSITVTPSSPTIPIGVTQQFAAVGAYSDGTNRDVTTLTTWSSGTPTCVTICNAGCVMASWSIADPYLACQVQRSASPSGFWQSVSGWLPRGFLTYVDTPPLSTSYAYRAVGRDIFGQVAAPTPVATIVM
jgi:hypothetical protein